MSPRRAPQPSNEGTSRTRSGGRTQRVEPTTVTPNSAKDATSVHREPSPPPNRRVAIYARVSSDAQAMKGTIDSQLEALRTHMSNVGADVVATYIDDGYSGARLDRPGLDELRDAAEAAAFEDVWCLSPDRLARSFPYQVLIPRRARPPRCDGSLHRLAAHRG
jgi:hypothetical protein